LTVKVGKYQPSTNDLNRYHLMQYFQLKNCKYYTTNVTWWHKLHPEIHDKTFKLLTTGEAES